MQWLYELTLAAQLNINELWSPGLQSMNTYAQYFNQNLLMRIYLKTVPIILNPYHAIGLFYTPWKHQKSSGFRMFRGCVKKDQCYKMG